jgi:hypothetical protein
MGDLKVIVEIPDNIQSLDKLEFTKLMARYAKYKVMWSLRSLEPEIVKENGQIKFILEEATIIPLGFSDSLSSKILALTSSIKFDD